MLNIIFRRARLPETNCPAVRWNSSCAPCSSDRDTERVSAGWPSTLTRLKVYTVRSHSCERSLPSTRRLLESVFRSIGVAVVFPFSFFAERQNNIIYINTAHSQTKTICQHQHALRLSINILLWASTQHHHSCESLLYSSLSSAIKQVDKFNNFLLF